MDGHRSAMQELPCPRTHILQVQNQLPLDLQVGKHLQHRKCTMAGTLKLGTVCAVRIPSCWVNVNLQLTGMGYYYVNIKTTAFSVIAVMGIYCTILSIIIHFITGMCK